MSIADIDMADRLGRRKTHLRPFEPSRWPTLDPLAVNEREETLPREMSPIPGAVPYLADLATGKLTVGIGDVTSSAKGTGARYNNGKPDLSLIPLRMLASALSDPGNPRAEVGALYQLGDFQTHHDASSIQRMMAVLGVDGWEECAHVFSYGKRKYAAWNWAKGMPWSVPVACAARHLLALIAGEHTDRESGLPHRGHVFCNGVMLLHYVDHYAEGNDLPPKELFA
jgi:hypothetical protein